MHALVISAKNTPMRVEERPGLKAGAGEAIVKVYAAALNHRDLWIQLGQYAGLKYPIVPGSDGSGVVVSVGGPEHQEWIGREVIINPALNWGSSKAYQDPHHFSILGLPEDGTFAEYVKVPVTALTVKPVHLSFEEAAALPLAGVTAYRALFTRAQLQRGEKILITGIGGGVALYALQYALALGGRVYVTSGSEEKLQKALALGAKGGVNYTMPNWVENLQEMAGAFPVTLDGAGGEGIRDLLNLSEPGGRLVFYGATRGNPSTLEARRIFWKQLNIYGSTMGSPDDFRAMVAFVSQHAIRPVIDKVFPFAEGESAFRWMEGARQFGKIVIKIH